MGDLGCNDCLMLQKQAFPPGKAPISAATAAYLIASVMVERTATEVLCEDPYRQDWRMRIRLMCKVRRINTRVNNNAWGSVVIGKKRYILSRKQGSTVMKILRVD